MEDVILALTSEDREAAERGLTGARVVCSVFVDEKAKVSAEVALPQGVSEEGTEMIRQAVERAVESLSAVVSTAVTGA
jgi:hypothetical protein